MSNINEQLLKKLIGDPSLLKMLEKMAASAPREKKEKRLKVMGNPAYVNRCSITCKLCGTKLVKYLCMAYDPDEKLYRTTCHATENLWPLLPVFDLVQRSSNCSNCAGALQDLSKEELIQKLLIYSTK